MGDSVSGFCSAALDLTGECLSGGESRVGLEDAVWSDAYDLMLVEEASLVLEEECLSCGLTRVVEALNKEVRECGGSFSMLNRSEAGIAVENLLQSAAISDL